MIAYIFLMQEIELVRKSFKKVRCKESDIFSSLIGYFKLTSIVFMEDWLLQRPTGNSWFLRCASARAAPAFYLFLFILYIGLLFKKDWSYWFEISLKMLETVRVEKNSL